MRDPKEFVENIPLRDCREGDRVWIRHQVGQGFYGSMILVKIKPLAKGMVQIKYTSAWGTARKPAKVLKIDLRGDLIVERRPPAPAKTDLVEGDVTVLAADAPGPNHDRDEDPRKVGIEEFAHLALLSAMEGRIWPGG